MRQTAWMKIVAAVVMMSAVEAATTARGPNDTGEVRRSKPAFISLQRKPIPWFALQTMTANDMTGWTPITSGATKGGASIVRLSATEARLIARGADDTLYAAPITPASPGGAIDSASWLSLRVTAASEANCVPVYGQTLRFGCAWLGPAGNAVFGIVATGATSFLVEDMGGSKASGRPALISARFDPQFGDSSARLMVLGNATMFLRTVDVNPSGAKGKDTGWTKLPGRYVGSAQCDAGKCAYVRSGGLLAFGDPSGELPPASVAAVPGGYSNVAPAPVKLASGRYAVVVRSTNGRIYRTVTADGSQWTPWADEGGTTKADASISCIANGEQPLCFAQGLDGRIYWKKLGTAAGL